MAEKIEYRNRKIVLDVKDLQPTIEIDGTARRVALDADTNAVVSPDLPYRAFGSAEELAKALVDDEADDDVA